MKFKNKPCVFCSEKINKLNYRILPLEVPYVNLFFHQGCLDKFNNPEEVVKFLVENMEKWYGIYV